ncbi:MAG: hypothetical protein ACJ78U_07305, partial [Myxococcales bacterium]
MRRRVFVVAGEYSANPRHLPPERRKRSFLTEPHPDISEEEVTRLFFRFPNRSEDGRTKPDDWKREFGLSAPIGLSDLFASAAHRALTSLHRLTGADYRSTRDSITDLFVTSMPGLDPNERMNIGLVPQALRAALALTPRVVAQYVVGTSDSGAWAFAQAVRAARNAEKPATIVVIAGQIIPAGYASQYQIRTVLGENDQARGMDMLAIGDMLMDAIRRNSGVSRAEMMALLERIAARKFDAAKQYPAGIQAGKAFKRDSPRTPYFDATDIAAPCCGAAACIVTSDEELALRVAASRSERYRAAPVTEVLGVGEGSSNENFLHRQSPLLFSTAVREALAATADDARRPLSVFASSAFGVAHDAFPSIELSFLLAMGLSFDRSAERAAEGWPNPFGGLLTFGHALGASGLVQVNKAHHLFSGDQRYLKDGPHRRQGFRETGALAFTSSVGGPLSHIVATLLRGGFEDVRPLAERTTRRRRDPGPSPLATDWREKRHQLRLVLPSYLDRLRARGAPKTEERASPATGGGRRPEQTIEPWYVEGTTYVSIRSSIRALGRADVQRLNFDGLEAVVARPYLEEVRAQLREVVLVVIGEVDRVASMFDAFRLLTDEVRDLVAKWRERGMLTPQATALRDEKAASIVKEALRVPLAIVTAPSPVAAERRRILFLPYDGLDYADFENVQVLWRSADGRLAKAPDDPSILPFWNVRATREESEPVSRSGSAHAVVDGIVETRDRPETMGELRLLRAWFSVDMARPILDDALRQLGIEAARPGPPMRALVVLAELADVGSFADPGAAHEILGHAARKARAFLEAYETNTIQIGNVLAISAVEAPPFRTRPDEGLVSGVRFARELTRAVVEVGLSLRTSVVAGEGAVYEDADGRHGLASPATARAWELLGLLRNGATRSSMIVDGAVGLVRERVQQWLRDWKAEP